MSILKRKMISIKVPENLLAAIDKTAFRQGKSRTQFMLDSCRSEMTVKNQETDEKSTAQGVDVQPMVSNLHSYFSTNIADVLTCCLDGKFDYYGFPINVCKYFPCDKYERCWEKIIRLRNC